MSNNFLTPKFFIPYDSRIKQKIELEINSKEIIQLNDLAEGMLDAERKNSGLSTPKFQVDWKQTTNSLSFIYKPTSDQPSTAYRLTRLNPNEFEIRIHLENSVIRHDYDLNGDVGWPPTSNENFENSEVTQQQQFIIIELGTINFN